jgi:sarcosine oxidase subunit gamma
MSFDIPTVDVSDILSEALYGPDEETFVHIADTGTCYSLRVKRTDLTAFKKASGWNLPSKIGNSFVTRNYSAFCLGPDEWQVLTEASKKDATRKKLEKLTPKFTFSYAVSLAAFPIGKCTRTVFEDAELMILRTAEDAFSVQVWRSFGSYLVSFFAKYLEDQR